MDFYGIDKNMIDDTASDCVSVNLTMTDYDWMTYHLKMRFILKDGTTHNVEEEYFGFDTADYTLRIIEGDTVSEVKFCATSEWVKRHIKEHLSAHLDTMDGTECFINDTETFIEEYNEIVALLSIARQNAPKEKTYKRGEKAND